MTAIVGTLITYGVNVVDPPGPGTLPPGWLLCDGSDVSRSTYANLFEVIGTAYGEGDGHTTFNLPDFRRRFMRGVDGGTGRDPDAKSRHAAHAGGNLGDDVGSIQDFATGLPASGALATGSSGSHSHYVNHLPTESSWYFIAGSHYAAWNSGSVPTSSDGAHQHSGGTGGDAESRPQNLYVHYLIYYGQSE
ncbi:MAG: tail fiber protein [Actinomycetota bacterium]|nr:tail fiber protein [Actinomycetota bacterium]